MPLIKNIVVGVSKQYSPQPIVLGQIDAGGNFGAYIKNTGRSWVWGNNQYNQLGDGSKTQRNTPVSVAGATKTFCQINGGRDHALAIDKNGKLWAWGRNFFGELGDNTSTSRCTPVSVAGATKTFCQIAAGLAFTLAIDKNGRAWGWGYNAFGQLGDNTTISKRTPVSVAGATKTFCQINGGQDHTLAIDKNGRAWAWGSNTSGKLGDNTSVSRLTPVSVAGATKTFCKIAAGIYHSVAIDKNGRLWAWGANSSGELGDNTTTSRCTPVSVAGATKTFCQIAAGVGFNIAIDKNGRLWSWGGNSTGQLGDNTTTSKRTPVSVAGATKTFCKITAQNLTDYGFSVAIDKNGQVWAWGNSAFGQLGDNTTISKRTPVSVAGATKTFCQIASGDKYAISIDKNGRAWAWGLNTSGKLGDNTSVSRLTPVSVAGATKTFCKIMSGDLHSIAIDKNGRLWAWGLNNTGQLGDNTTTSRLTPVSVAGATKTFCQITSNGCKTLAIDKNGRAWGWGYNPFGQLGDNTTISKRTPVSVAGATKTFCQINGGQDHTLAIDKNGRLWSWGLNSNGQLGDNTTTSRLTPVSVAGATKTFCQITAGWESSAGIDKNGQVWTWGRNVGGTLGDNTTTSRCTPVSVAGATKTFCKIAAGAYGHIAIDKNGRLWAWGLNNTGQLGDNSTTNRCTPVSVAGATKTFCQITHAYCQTIAIDKNGRAWSWGTNSSGALGIDSGDRLTPVRVCNL